MEAKNITKSKPETFITLKEHKDNFFNKPSCCLINATKNELGKINEKIIEQINQEMLKKTDVNEWNVGHKQRNQLVQ